MALPSKEYKGCMDLKKGIYDVNFVGFSGNKKEFVNLYLILRSS